MSEFSIDYGDLTLAMGTTAYKDLKKEHDALCEWVNQLSELTHGYREVSEKEIFEVIEDYQNSAHKLKEERDKYKKALVEISTWISFDEDPWSQSRLVDYMDELKDLVKKVIP